MATLNLFEPGDITSVYSSVVENKNNWLLLHYVDDSYSEIGLHSFGNEGLEELKNKIDDLDKVFIAFYQEEYERDPGYVIINYIPPSTSGVTRARVLVHSRRMGTFFKKHEAVFTVDSLSLLTSDNIHHAITKQGNSPIAKTPRGTTPEIIQEAGDFPTIPDSSSVDEPSSPIHPVRPPSPFSENPMVGRTSSSSQPRPLSPFGHKGFFGNLIKRKKKTKSLENVHNEGPPPPPPKFPPAVPKDKATYYPAQPISSTQSPRQPARTLQEGGHLRHRRSRSMSDFAVISHTDDVEDGGVDAPELTHPQVPLKGKWAPLPTIPHDPAERARRRRELRSKREQEEQEEREAEMRRQEKIKLEKEALLRLEAEEERQRKEEVEKEIRRVRQERRRREILEREEEEKKQFEFEERKRLNRDRRMEEHRRLEQWREEQARKSEAAARQAEEATKREEMERKNRIQEAATKLKAVKGEPEVSGWLTLLNEESLAWKRRYYRFIGSRIFLYRDQKDLTSPLEQLDLKGNVKALKEWNEGYEDLEAIQFSFVVEFKYERRYWPIYTDSEEEKFKLLGLFKVAGGL